MLDVVVRPERPLVRGSDVPGSLGFRVGGSAANTCRAFVALGGAATFIGAVGDDAWGRRLGAALRRDGVSLRLARVGQPTARLLALVEPDGERSFVTQRGAADHLRPAEVKRAWLQTADVLHLPAYSLLAEPLGSAALSAARHAREAGALISLDLASRDPLLSAGRDAATATIAELGPDLILANSEEADALSGRRGVRWLLRLAPVLVIKEGSAGCRVLWRPHNGATREILELDVATTPIEAADTTGAGDAFDAGFLYALTEATGDGRGQPRDIARAQDARQALRRAQVLRRAAVAGHRSAGRALSRPRPELVI